VDVVEELLWRGDADVHANDDEALLWATDNGHEVRACSSHAIMPYYIIIIIIIILLLWAIDNKHEVRACSSHAIMPYYCCCDCFNIGMQVCVYHC